MGRAVSYEQGIPVTGGRRILTTCGTNQGSRQREPATLRRSCDKFHPGGNPGATLKLIFHRCHPILVAFVWELTQETIDLPLGCLQGGGVSTKGTCDHDELT